VSLRGSLEMKERAKSRSPLAQGLQVRGMGGGGKRGGIVACVVGRMSRAWGRLREQLHATRRRCRRIGFTEHGSRGSGCH
jgi:hypothetical protein